MNSDELIADGRRLARPCRLLTADGEGEVAAFWHGPSLGEDRESEFHCWITIDSSRIPDAPELPARFFSVFADQNRCVGGRIEFFNSWPDRTGIPLFARSEEILPPIDAVFAKGSEAVGEWRAVNRWERSWGYNGNFKDAKTVEEYERVFTREYPLYRSDIYASLGGWHMPWPEGDWFDLLDEKLLLMTAKDSEPWIEAWRLCSGEFRVIQRIS